MIGQERSRRFGVGEVIVVTIADTSALAIVTARAVDRVGQAEGGVLAERPCNDHRHLTQVTLRRP